MAIRRSLSILLVLATIGTVANTAQKPVPASPAKISPEELIKAAQVPSLEQIVLQAAAAKLREGKQTQASSVELPVTIRQSALGCSYVICVGTPPHMACRFVPCNSMR